MYGCLRISGRFQNSDYLHCVYAVITEVLQFHFNAQRVSFDILVSFNRAYYSRNTGIVTCKLVFVCSYCRFRGNRSEITFYIRDNIIYRLCNPYYSGRESKCQNRIVLERIFNADGLCVHGVGCLQECKVGFIVYPIYELTSVGVIVIIVGKDDMGCRRLYIHRISLATIIKVIVLNYYIGTYLTDRKTL